MSKIVTPFRPTLTITIEVNEQTNELQVKTSKPTNPAVLLNTLLESVRGLFSQVTVQARPVPVPVPPQGKNNGQ